MSLARPPLRPHRMGHKFITIWTFAFAMSVTFVVVSIRGREGGHDVAANSHTHRTSFPLCNVVVIPGLGVGANQRCQPKVPTKGPLPFLSVRLARQTLRPAMDIVSDRPSAVTVHAVIPTDFRHSRRDMGDSMLHSSGIGQCHVKKQTWNKQKLEWDTDARRQLLFACARPSRLPCFFAL